MGANSSLMEELLKKFDQLYTNKKFFNFLVGVLIVFGLFLVAGILFPTFVSIILNILWISLLTVVIIFFLIGVLVIVGLRKEAMKLLDILLEGSLTLVDFINFVKELWRRFIELVREFLLYAAPILAYLSNLLIYIVLLSLYKFVGRTYDVTVLTFVITIALTTTVAFLTKPIFTAPTLSSWKAKFKHLFMRGFVDGFEVVLFLFFLTMDSTDIFFFPDSLNVLLRAELGDYDLMVRGFVYSDHLKITSIIIIIAVFTEIVRNAMRIVATARMYYKNEVSVDTEGIRISWAVRFKDALRKSFIELKDDLIEFVTYNTFLFAVFILFPRLKLLTLAIASVTSLFMDLIIPGRLIPTPRTDLIAKILSKLFGLKKNSIKKTATATA